ncbi:MAG: hypothetical protein GXY77_17295, partial [Fibrobacter sp.]|nr:hypothetical protein [Fibrobacter sp.]
DLWGDFAKVSGRRVMQKKWGEYKEMLSGKSLLYFYTDRGGLHNIDINLSWPGSITRNISSNTSESPVNSYIAENITFNMKFDNIVLEPVTNEIVSGTLAEVYNPSVVVLNETASFKIEVSGVESEMVSWRSENEKVKFLNGSIESDIGIGKTVKVKGNSLGGDKLIVDIEGYDGRSPEISFDVLNWKNINVYTCIVKNELNKDSAFTDSGIEEAIDKGNEIFKQIGVKMIRVPYVNALANKEKYRILTDVGTMVELINIKRNTIDGVEIYFVAGQTFDDNMIAEAYYDKGIVITKYGSLKDVKEGDTLIRFSPYILAHEVLQCMRTDASTDECVADIYDYYWVGNKKESIPDNTDIAESHIPLDWGTGYYRAKTKLSDVVKRLLMYGYNIENRFDIPRGDVLGFDKYNVAKHVKCGGIVELKDRSFRNDY